MEENVRRERIRGIPQPGELRTVSAALLAAGPVALFMPFGCGRRYPAADGPEPESSACCRWSTDIAECCRIDQSAGNAGVSGCLGDLFPGSILEQNPGCCSGPAPHAGTEPGCRSTGGSERTFVPAGDSLSSHSAASHSVIGGGRRTSVR